MSDAKRQSADSLARDYTAEAIGVIADVMRDPLAEFKDRLRAAEMLVERGHGKATQAIIAIPIARRTSEQLAMMSDEELLERIRETPLPRLAAPVEDAEFTVESDIDPLLE